MVISKPGEAKRLKFQIKLLDEKINELKNSLDIQGMRYADLPKIEGFKNNLIELQVERLIELETKKYHLQMRIDEVLDKLSKLPELSYMMPIYSGIALIGAIIICCSYIIVKKINQLREERNK